MIRVGLDDGTFFGSRAMGYGGENAGQESALLQWERDGEGAGTKVWTDLTLHRAPGDPSRRKIAVLVEPRGLTDTHYRDAERLREHFEVIFTYDKAYVDKGEPFRFYPLGGSWIKDWAMFPKRQEVSILTSFKKLTAGHQLRHEIVEGLRLRNLQVDVFGEPYTLRIASKATALRPYRYSIVVESDRRNWYFSEKLIDCISQGTVPIYWGCPDVGKFFDARGIISFETAEQLYNLLFRIGPEDYRSRYEALTWNLAAALDYRTAEDYLAGQAEFEEPA